MFEVVNGEVYGSKSQVLGTYSNTLSNIFFLREMLFCPRRPFGGQRTT